MKPQAGPNVQELRSRGQHHPMRPGWFCDTCSAEWPCVPARERILHTWTSFGRALTMSAYFEQASQDLGNTPAKLLWRRFLGWVRDHEFEVEGTPWV
jgi:hypothetical protein